MRRRRTVKRAQNVDHLRKLQKLQKLRTKVTKVTGESYGRKLQVERGKILRKNLAHYPYPWYHGDGQRYLYAPAHTHRSGRKGEIGMMYWRATEWHQDGVDHRALFLPWWQVSEVLGHRYDGDQGDLELIKAAALRAGAPSWIQRVEHDGIEEKGIYLIGGPLVYSEVLDQSYHLWELENCWGVVEHEDTTWYLTQMPYIAGTDKLSWKKAVAIGVFDVSEVTPELPWYEAIAINADGDTALVWWTVKDHWKDIEDEADMCDWNKPARVTKL